MSSIYLPDETYRRAYKGAGSSSSPSRLHGTRISSPSPISHGLERDVVPLALHIKAWTIAVDQ